MPEAEKVLFEDPVAPTYRESAHDSISFICKMSLAVNEMAMIEIHSRLVQKTLNEKY